MRAVLVLAHPPSSMGARPRLRACSATRAVLAMPRSVRLQLPRTASRRRAAPSGVGVRAVSN
jgi:hypothetical protein